MDTIITVENTEATTTLLPNVELRHPVSTAYKKKRFIPTANSAAYVDKSHHGVHGRCNKCSNSTNDLRRVSAYCIADSISLNQSFLELERNGMRPIEHKEFYYYHIRKYTSGPPPMIKTQTPPQSQHHLETLMELRIDDECSSISTPSSCLYEGTGAGLGAQVQPEDASAMDQDKGMVVVFENGVVVFWDLTPSIEFRVIKMLEVFSVNVLDHKLVDDMRFEYACPGLTPAQTTIFQDKIILDSYDPLVKVAMSQSISQSVKISSFEENLELIIEATKDVPVHLSQKGKICLSQRRVGQLLGTLYIQKNAINLHSNILDTPEFFWTFQDYERYHIMTEKYLEIKPRVRTLNHRLMVVRDLIDMCRSDLEARGSFRLEIIVIVLIFFELVFMVLQFLHDVVI
ncbi:hypothetical protein SAMD00019534_053040 [Acytostelium subglobosum LB1]|uniref:hypothetical protein n=1 Tax=Acytostelium subglobosum LB1 TaxID=1410327 RepID=UPI000644E9C4|nr:hypothetical protein SAMD00019534_053040 [Acytostelium subglobosum LB1]GAM22129.1 hypothetical protein SAMD00019534_053040 [Acytostelium subglobosum LB1]|eukprot:XP_012755229.1 hypothetical protein SAMD00019534_053040 [Acytostelium subglobosum LB1]